MAPRYVPRNYRWFNKLLRFTYGQWLFSFFRVRVSGHEIAKSLHAPFVVVGNHVTILDPFILGSLLKEPVYWITSDGNMRTRLMRALLRLVGSIPKAKAIPDMQTVNWTVEVIRKRGGVVGIFPEGEQSWDGVTLPLIPATAKLLKLLRAPVLAAVIKGGFLSLPRWSWARRRGRIDIEFSLLFTKEELKSLDASEVQERLASALAHDEFAWQEEARVGYEALRKAEHLELGLFMCPECERIGTMRSARSRFNCISCGLALRIDTFGRFRSFRGAGPRFDNLRDWDRWQAGAFRRYLETSARDRPSGQLFSDAGAMLYRGHKTNPLRSLRSGTLILYPDRIELATLLGERISFAAGEIDGVGVLKRNILDFYVGHDLYQVRFPFRHISARKWAAALDFLRAPRD
jgi:1-acyl-sn-glycerol-3-phosphate acyltransferase